MSKPIQLYSHGMGPNPWKVAIILEELGLPYNTTFLSPVEVKQEPFISLNPNGRVPAIEDPNTGIVLWESAAIMEYLISEYDNDNTLTYTTSPEKHHMKQWLYFQMSGQGPYFGQASWFLHIHHEKLPSAQDRYLNEVKRVLGVLDKVMKKRHEQGREYLVGDKCTVADLCEQTPHVFNWGGGFDRLLMRATNGLAFVIWNHLVPIYLFKNNLDIPALYPDYHAWHSRLVSRSAVSKVIQERERVVGQKQPQAQSVKEEEG